jgi:hypothetical protein
MNPETNLVNQKREIFLQKRNKRSDKKTSTHLFVAKQLGVEDQREGNVDDGEIIDGQPAHNPNKVIIS